MRFFITLYSLAIIFLIQYKFKAGLIPAGIFAIEFLTRRAWTAEYRIRKSIKKEIFDRFNDRHYWNARRMRSDDETPYHERMRWVTHQTPQSFKMDFFEAKAEEYEDLLEYKNPFADTPGGTGTAVRSSGTRGMHVSEAVQVLQLTEATENHIHDVRFLLLSQLVRISRLNGKFYYLLRFP